MIPIKTTWNGLGLITGYKKKNNAKIQNGDAGWAEQLNVFYTRFEKADEDSPFKERQDQETIHLEEGDVRKVLNAIKLNKACGPDGISPRSTPQIMQPRHCTNLLDLRVSHF
jgi:hypothetical protein